MSDQQRLFLRQLQITELIRASVLLKLISNASDENALISLKSEAEKYKNASDDYQ